MKFVVDEIWKNRDGDLWIIKDFQKGNYPVIACSIDWQPDSDTGLLLSLTASGGEMNNNIPSPFDLIKCVGTKKDFPEYFL